MAAPLSIDSLDLTSIKRKSALITGGASGLGLETAFLLASSGAYVTIADIQPSEQTIKAFKSRSLAVQYVRCDTTDWSQQVIAFKQAVNFTPSRSLDIVCCFAGVDHQVNLVDHIVKSEPSIDDEPVMPYTQELDTNLKGTYYSANLALHYFGLPCRKKKKVKKLPPRSLSASDSDSENDRNRQKTVGEAEADVKPADSVKKTTENPSKSLIFVSSMSGYIHDPHNSIYTASKFGVRGLFSSIAKEASKQLNVRCNLIAPWGVRTPMTIPILERLEKAGYLKREETKDKGERADRRLTDNNDAQKVTINGFETEQVQTVQGGLDVKSEESTQAVMSGALKDEDTVTVDPTELRLSTVELSETIMTQSTEESTGNTFGTEPDPKPDVGQVDSRAEPSFKPEDEPQTEGVHSFEPETKTNANNDHSPQPTLNPESPQTPELESEIRHIGITFAKASDVASTVVKCCVDASISGRALAIMPEGVFDLGDDMEGGYGGDILRQLMATRKEAGDLIIV